MSEEDDQEPVAQASGALAEAAPCCSCCNGNTVTGDAEDAAGGESEEGFLAAVFNSIEDVAEDIQEACHQAASTAYEAVADAVDTVRDGLVDSLGLEEKFKDLADKTLDDIAPKAGEKVVEDAMAGGFIPGFQKLDDMTPRDLDAEAKEACATKILSFRKRIHDFCGDVVEYLKEGSNMMGAILKCFHKVVSWILRACREGVEVAVELIKKVIPDCCESCCLNCMSLGQKIMDFVTTVFNKVVNMVEDFIQECMKAMGFPDWMVEKIDFNGDNDNPDNARDDDETEAEKSQKKKNGEEAPQQETMGDSDPAKVPEDEAEKGPDTL